MKWHVCRRENLCLDLLKVKVNNNLLNMFPSKTLPFNEMIDKLGSDWQKEIYDIILNESKNELEWKTHSAEEWEEIFGPCPLLENEDVIKVYNDNTNSEFKTFNEDLPETRIKVLKDTGYDAVNAILRMLMIMDTLNKEKDDKRRVRTATEGRSL